MLCHVVEFLMYNLQLDSRFLDVEKKVNYLIFVRRVTFYDIEDRVEHRSLKQAATWLNFWCSNRPLTDTGNWFILISSSLTLSVSDFSEAQWVQSVQYWWWCVGYLSDICVCQTPSQTPKVQPGCSYALSSVWVFSEQLNTRFLDVGNKVTGLFCVWRVAFSDTENRVEHQTFKQASTWSSFLCSNRPLVDIGNWLIPITSWTTLSFNVFSEAQWAHLVQ